MSATETKKATAATSENINEFFHEAMRCYEQALKSGIQLQEESVNLWKDLLSKLGSPEEFQAKLESMTKEAFPKARQRMEESVETFNRTSKQTIDLFEKNAGRLPGHLGARDAAPRARSDRKLADCSADQRSQRPGHEC